MAWACVECEKGAATVFFILTESLSVKCLCIIFYMSFSLSSLMFSLICRFLPKDKNYPYLTLRSIWCDTAVIQDVWHLYKDKGRKCFHDGMTMTMRRIKTNPPQEKLTATLINLYILWSTWRSKLSLVNKYPNLPVFWKTTIGSPPDCSRLSE